jgi:hypothetical protein
MWLRGELQELTWGMCMYHLTFFICPIIHMPCFLLLIHSQ